MSTSLRHIALYVKELEKGGFAWVLTERRGESWQEISSALLAVKTYQRAVADGLLALQAMVPDLDAGPRAISESSSPGAATAQVDDAHAEHVDHAAGPYFGFGPAA